MKKKCLMLGVGGMAHSWIFDFWARQAQRMEFAALVDVNSDALKTAGEKLGLPASALFTDAERAFERVEADFCCIVTPPRFHRIAVELACARKMDILSEKPIAASWEDAVSITQAVQKAGVKMMVTQNYRYTPRILTLKTAISQLGQVNYAVGRYAGDYRARGSLGADFLYQMAHPLLVECAIHHFDQLRNLTGGDAETVCGYEWHPGLARGAQNSFEGSDAFAGQPCALFVVQMSNGAFAHYEGSNVASGEVNSWHREAYRVECEGGTAILDRDDKVWIVKRENGQSQAREMATVAVEFDGHAAIANQFLDWLEGGAAPITVLDDNLKSNALLFAAIRASEEKRVVNVREMLTKAGIGA